MKDAQDCPCLLCEGQRAGKRLLMSVTEVTSQRAAIAFWDDGSRTVEWALASRVTATPFGPESAVNICILIGRLLMEIGPRPDAKLNVQETHLNPGTLN